MAGPVYYGLLCIWLALLPTELKSLELTVTVQRTELKGLTPMTKQTHCIKLVHYTLHIIRIRTVALSAVIANETQWISRLTPDHPPRPTKDANSVRRLQYTAGKTAADKKQR